MTIMSVKEVEEYCEELAAMGVIDLVKRRKKVGESTWKRNEFGTWLVDNGLFEKFNIASPAEQQTIREQFERRKK